MNMHHKTACFAPFMVHSVVVIHIHNGAVYVTFQFPLCTTGNGKGEF